MSEDKDPIIFIKHILESIENIESFVKNIEEKEFLKSKVQLLGKLKLLVRRLKIYPQVSEINIQKFIG